MLLNLLFLATSAGTICASGEGCSDFLEKGRKRKRNKRAKYQRGSAAFAAAQRAKWRADRYYENSSVRRAAKNCHADREDSKYRSCRSITSQPKGKASRHPLEVDLDQLISGRVCVCIDSRPQTSNHMAGDRDVSEEGKGRGKSERESTSSAGERKSEGERRRGEKRKEGDSC